MAQVDGQRKDFIPSRRIWRLAETYLTMDFQTEADIIRALGKILKTGISTKVTKPVYWVLWVDRHRQRLKWNTTRKPLMPLMSATGIPAEDLLSRFGLSQADAGRGTLSL